MALRALLRSSLPVITITLVCGASASISLNVAKPSLALAGSGGKPKSKVTTLGSWRLTAAIALSRVSANITS